MKANLKRIIAVLCAAAATTTLMASCGDNTNNTSTGGNTEGGLTAGTYTFMTWESDTMNQQILKSFEKFTSEHPEITVELTPAPLSDYGTKIKQMISSGTAPDIFMVGNDWVIQYGSSGNLYDWTALAEADKIMDGYYPGVVENWKVDGKLYGFPGLLNTYGVFYNKDIFDANDIAYPENGWTYDDMFDIAAKLTSDEGGTHTYGLTAGYGWDAFATAIYSVSAGGSGFVDGIKDNDHVTIDDKYKEAVEKIRKAIADQTVTPAGFDTSNVATQFMEGKLPMLSAGQWFADEFIRNGKEGLNWDMVAWPVASKDSPSTTVYDCTGWASHKDIKNPETVYQLIKFIHTEMYAEVLPQTPVAPAAASDYTQPYYDKLAETGHEATADGINWMLEAENKVAVRFLDAFAADANPFIEDVWADILNSKRDMSELDTMVDNVNAAISAYLAE